MVMIWKIQRVFSKITGSRNGTHCFKVLLSFLLHLHLSPFSYSTCQIRGCRGAFNPEIIHRPFQLIAMERNQCVCMGRNQGMHEWKSYKTCFRTPKLEWPFRWTKLEPVRSTSGSEFQKQLPFRSNTWPFWPTQPQITLSQRQQLHRWIPRVHYKLTSFENHSSVWKSNHWSDSCFFTQAQTIVHSLLTRQ